MNNRKFTFFLVAVTILFITFTIIFRTGNSIQNNSNHPKKISSSTGVCPPFNLYDEAGNLIDPVNNINSDIPYSPKQTCGKCHDYEKITKGFHFQQGRGEKPTGEMSKRYQWVTSPGVYGGTWCSPAPLYRKLAFKNNKSSYDIDMTSFEYITATCGYCHPGGGSLEFDRDGNRYDKKMQDTSFKLISGGDNGFDGDYFKAKWNETGVIEADCMLCHLPEYDYKKRNAMIDSLNFKWAATEGSGLGSVEGSVKSTEKVKVNYDLSRFDKDGKISMHFVREPRNETCLNCHAKPDWKKKGTDFSSRRDVHIAAGLKCINCHPAGSNAPNELINEKEEHNFGKGDDPGGFVRNDLDNTVRTCENCHIEGYLNAPIAKHSWLPPLHLEKIACQTCHIPVKTVKSALVQASDIYNNGPKISPPTKHIWTFYDQNMNYWNHYGELNMFTPKDMPTDESIPIYAKYKDKIFPVNPVHSSWPGILTEGKDGLDQPKMKDIYTMWTEHLSDSAKYPLLKTIVDDNGDNVAEVNKENEIDAFIKSVTKRLNDIKYDLTNKKVVWVNNDRMYSDGNNFVTLTKNEFESSPYASVYKYSHNVFPSKAALGINGCTDCHSNDAGFFTASIVKYPFGKDSLPVVEPQFSRMGISAARVYIGIFREEYLKNIFYLLLIIAFIAALIFFIIRLLFLNFLVKFSLNSIRMFLLFIYSFVLLMCLVLYFKPNMVEFVLPSRFVLDGNHFLLAMFNSIISLLCFRYLSKLKDTNRFEKITVRILIISLVISAITGTLMVIQFDCIYSFIAYAYTLFDLSQVILTTIVISTIFLFTRDSIFRYVKEKTIIN